MEEAEPMEASEISQQRPKFESSHCTHSLHDATRERRWSTAGSEAALIRIRSLNASNQAVLSDSDLRMQEAGPSRSYSSLQSDAGVSMTIFIHLMRRFYYQLTVGCGNTSCKNRLCHSCSRRICCKPEYAVLMSMELASQSEAKFLCPGCQNKTAMIQLSDLNRSPQERTFLQSLFLTSPFQRLFTKRLRRHSADYSDVGLATQGQLSPETCATVDRKCLSNQRSVVQFDLGESLDFRADTAESTSVDWPAMEEKEFTLTHLTLPMTKALVAKYDETEDLSFLISTLRTVFTSSEILNLSFRKSVGNVLNLSSALFGEEEEVLLEGLDLDAVRETYSLLMKVEPKELLHRTMTDATEILLTALEAAKIQPTEIHQLLIILENPLLGELSCHEVLKKLCKVLASLNEYSQQELVAYLIEYDSTHFSRLVKMFQDHFNALLYPKHRADPSLFHHLKVLALLYDVNKKSASCGESIVAYRDFYCDGLAKKLDFKADCIKWNRRLTSDSQGPATPPTPDDYCFLDFPFLFDPSAKVRMLHIHAVIQMTQEYHDALTQQSTLHQAVELLEDRNLTLFEAFLESSCPFFVLEVRRDHLVEDALMKLAGKRHHLKKPLKISYVGGGEQGLDMGGLQKEFFHLIVDAVFDPSYGMFMYSDETNCFWFNSASLEAEKEFQFVGMLLGLAIYNGIILDVHFPRAVYKKLQGESLTLADLTDCQPLLGRSLRELLEYEGDVESTFCYSFQISYMVYGHAIDVDLIPNGYAVSVTNHNRDEFVDLYIHHLLVESVAPQFESFACGLKSVCGTDVLSLCRSDELEMLICGSPELDFSSLETSAHYEDGYSRDSPVVQWFWAIAHQMTTEQKQQLLLFVTGSNRVPLKGISSLAFTIQRNGDDSDRLPTAMTCFNRLLLPEYCDQRKLRDRLMKALENSRGFGLV